LCRRAHVGATASSQPSVASAAGGESRLRVSARLILVIDDNPDVVALARFALEEVGYCVHAALGCAALHLAAEERPALILLDLGLPELDGREIAQRLRADPRTQDIPIVTVSGHDPFGALAHAVDSNDHLPKPFTTAALREMVARWVPEA